MVEALQGGRKYEKRVFPAQSGFESEGSPESSAEGGIDTVAETCGECGQKAPLMPEREGIENSSLRFHHDESLVQPGRGFVSGEA